MSAANTATILRAARSLIADPKRWTRGAAARDAVGCMAIPVHESAVCWCAFGAISRVTGGGDAWFDATAALEKQIGGDDVPEFNDFHSHAEVLAIFDSAIAEQEALSHGNA